MIKTKVKINQGREKFFMQEIVINNKRHKEKNIVKKQTGITLIALVITIIVLLILAGVSIATLTGENGILTKAQEASIQTRGAQVEEVINLWKSETEMNENSNSDATVKSEDELLQELLIDKQVYENEIDRVRLKKGDRY